MRVHKKCLTSQRGQTANPDLINGTQLHGKDSDVENTLPPENTLAVSQMANGYATEAAESPQQQEPETMVTATGERASSDDSIQHPIYDPNKAHQYLPDDLVSYEGKLRRVHELRSPI